ncbi:MAG: hypothetical protein K6F35_08760 [Lachnospiraceae bacterium]|nr:hypothetical protein [Lachnospiraceae bacterium]
MNSTIIDVEAVEITDDTEFDEQAATFLRMLERVDRMPGGMHPGLQFAKNKLNDISNVQPPQWREKVREILEDFIDRKEREIRGEAVEAEPAGAEPAEAEVYAEPVEAEVYAEPVEAEAYAEPVEAEAYAEAPFEDAVIDPEDVEEPFEDAVIDPEDIEEPFEDAVIDPEDVEEPFEDIVLEPEYYEAEAAGPDPYVDTSFQAAEEEIISSAQTEGWGTGEDPADNQAGIWASEEAAAEEIWAEEPAEAVAAEEAAAEEMWAEEPAETVAAEEAAAEEMWAEEPAEAVAAEEAAAEEPAEDKQAEEDEEDEELNINQIREDGVSLIRLLMGGEAAEYDEMMVILVDGTALRVKGGAGTFLIRPSFEAMDKPIEIIGRVDLSGMPSEEMNWRSRMATPDVGIREIWFLCNREPGTMEKIYDTYSEKMAGNYFEYVRSLEKQLV